MPIPILTSSSEGPAEFKKRLRIEIIQQIRYLPKLVEETLLLVNDTCRKLASVFSMVPSVNFLGRQYMYPIALESALNLKELAYINTSGYPSGEIKHGPLASIGRDSRCFLICPEENLKDKNILTMKEISARGGDIILVKQKHQEFPKDSYGWEINIPKARDFLLPILSVIPMQLFAMYSAKVRKFNVDQPRHLAKSVTVE